MAYEAVIIELLGNAGDPVRYTVADGVLIPKGSLMYLSGDREATISSAQGQIFVGIATTEKVASDGITALAVYTNGIFDLTDEGAGITLGDMVKLGGVNTIATQDEAGVNAAAETVGLALEAATGSEVIAVRIMK